MRIASAEYRMNQ